MTDNAETRAATGPDQMIDVWEVWPHYDTDYDYLLTDDGEQVDEFVRMATEKWLDAGPRNGEEFLIRIRCREMTAEQYAEATAPAP